MKILISSLVISYVLTFSTQASSSDEKPVFTFSSVEAAEAARYWLISQDVQDGISEEEAVLVSRIYWKTYRSEYRFMGGALGEPEDQGENWYIPYYYGTG